MICLTRNRRTGGSNQMSGRSQERGQSLLEFAMVLPVLLLLAIGTIEFGTSLSSLQHPQQSGASGC